ncbi:hypothetical protein Mapa_017202 [Marchantia paleacea]|nr:hypothetical protein Mapa_017202 [Marchantia paleacea]
MQNFNSSIESKKYHNMVGRSDEGHLSLMIDEMEGFIRARESSQFSKRPLVGNGPLSISVGDQVLVPKSPNPQISSSQTN